MTTSLRTRLLVSHFAVAAVGSIALGIVAAVVTNITFQGRIRTGMGGMGNGPGGTPWTGRRRSKSSRPSRILSDGRF